LLFEDGQIYLSCNAAERALCVIRGPEEVSALRRIRVKQLASEQQLVFTYRHRETERS
jgi:hypothetical protein